MLPCRQSTNLAFLLRETAFTKILFTEERNGLRTTCCLLLLHFLSQVPVLCYQLQSENVSPCFVSSISPGPLPLSLYQAKKGITKHCPVCNDDIPVRLLQSHVAFELEKLEELSKQVPQDVELPDILDNTSTPGAGCVTTRVHHLMLHILMHIHPGHLLCFNTLYSGLAHAAEPPFAHARASLITTTHQPPPPLQRLL